MTICDLLPSDIGIIVFTGIVSQSGSRGETSPNGAYNLPSDIMGDRSHEKRWHEIADLLDAPLRILSESESIWK